MSDSGDLTLFPLNTVLFPLARTALQIFESRYMDMVRDCLRRDQRIGIILLESGSEVFQPGSWSTPQVADTGCAAAIVDWDALPQGRLGLVLEGCQRFRLLRSWEDDKHLLHGAVEWLDDEPDQALPESFELLPSLLAQLAQHPTIQKLGMDLQPHSSLTTANQLAQVLPIGLQEKQRLLCLSDPIERLQQLEQLLDELQA